jgi:hypothetical protein
MTSRAFSFQLVGLDSPDGQISMRDLVHIGDALQLTATRIARQVGGKLGPGRSPAAIDRMSELRLRGIGQGSTVLELELGMVDSLPLEGGDEELVATRFAEAVASIAANAPPSWASPGVTAAIGKVVRHVAESGASKLEALRGIGDEATPLQTIDLDLVDQNAWKVDEQPDIESVSFIGRLDKVDLRARRFRVRDDVGHDVTLEDVVDVDAAAQLIGQRVVAVGMAEHGSDGRVVRIVEPVLARENLPTNWFAAIPDERPAGSQVLRPGIEGVTEDEVSEFLAEIRG